VVPTTAKVGIDATIGEGIPKERFERIAYAYADTARIDDYVSGKADPEGVAAAANAEIAALADKIADMIGKEPVYYQAIAEAFSDYAFPVVARAPGHLHATERLWQDPRGRMCLRDSEFAAKPPTAR
jgi:2,5-furandicarboxylate decarboxylase 1